MRKFSLSSAKWVREVIHASVKTSCEAHFLHRLHCILLVAEGRSCYEVARWFGEDPRTVERWVHALNEHGIEGLREHHSGERPTKLADKQMQCLALDLQKPPRVCGYSEQEMERKALGAAPGGLLRDQIERTSVPADNASAGRRRDVRGGLNPLIMRQGF